MRLTILISMMLACATVQAQYVCLTCPQEIPTSYNTTPSKGKPGTELEDNTTARCAYGICEGVYSRLINAKKDCIAMPIEGGKYAYFRKWEFFTSFEQAKYRLNVLKKNGTIGKDAYVRQVYGFVMFD